MLPLRKLLVFLIIIILISLAVLNTQVAKNALGDRQIEWLSNDQGVLAELVAKMRNAGINWEEYMRIPGFGGERARIAGAGPVAEHMLLENNAAVGVVMGKMANETLREQLGRSTCAHHIQQYFREFPPQVRSRDEFEQYLCRFHNAVNKRLGKEEFDCSTVHDHYDCGCGPDLVRYDPNKDADEDSPVLVMDAELG
ncbi:hypothetical protein EV182_000090 [Spiromyces aspiralis]|uniref:Uncharacterized protein n=1 Tax=Spiromyces aspiralis TaxID=68401 RepID=A0ACC1HK20_9FUNG|nr:hypothetical protein EV182_000090 [Spiromyces aspiralis]